MITNKLINNSLFYLSGNIISKLLQFSITIIISYYILPEEYGILSLYLAIVGILSSIIGLSPHLFITFNYKKLGNTKLQLYRAIINRFLYSSVLFFFILLFLTDLFYDDIFGVNIVYLYFGVFFIAFEKQMGITLVYLQMEGLALQYFFVNIIKAILLFIICLTLLVLGYNFLSRIYADVASMMIVMILIWHFFDKNLILYRKNNKILKKYLAFSIPALPHVFSLWGMTSIDRFFLEGLASIHDVGIYSLGYSIAMAVFFFNDSIIKALAPNMLEHIKNGASTSKSILIKYKVVASIAMLFMVVFFCILFENLEEYVISSDYIGITEVVWYVAFGNFFYGVSTLFTMYVYNSGKIYMVSIISVLGLILNSVLNFYLIQKYGMLGAAISTTISYLFMLIITIYYANKYYPLGCFSKTIISN